MPWPHILAGVVGAVIGAAVAYGFQVRESRQLAKGAARAVYIELAANMTAARMGAKGDPLGRVGRDVYLAEASRLAVYLRPNEMLAVAWAYQLIPEAEEALATLRAGGGRKADDPERAILAQAAAAIEPATTMLNPRVWSPGERAAHNRRVRE